MARISEAQGPSNNPEERWAALSLGTSSSTSDDSSEWSGDSAQETPASLHWPAPAADSPSSPDPQAKPLSSTAPTTDGSGQETGQPQQSPQDSSEDSASLKEAGQGTDPQPDLEPIPGDDPYAGLGGHELMTLAREAYNDSNYDEAERVLNRAEATGEIAPSAVETARGYVRTARERADTLRPPTGHGEGSPAEPEGPSEGDPAGGGYLVP